MSNSVNPLYWLILLSGVFTLIAYFDYSRAGRILSPTSVLVFPFLAVSVSCVLVGPLLGFVPVDNTVIVIWAVFSALFWVIGQATTALFGDSKSRLTKFNAVTHSRELEVALLVFGMIIACILLIHAYMVLRSMGGIQAIITKDFTKSWGTGWAGHLRVVLMIILIRLIGSVRQFDLEKLLPISLIFLVLLMYQSKGAVLAPILSGVLYRVISGNLVLRLRHGVYAVGGGFVIFNLAYLIGWGVVNPELLFDSSTYLFFASHFMSYLYSGLLGFSESLQLNEFWSGNGLQALLAPVWNLLSIATEGRIYSVVEMVQENYIQIHESGYSSNVNTFFGTVYLAVGKVEAIAIVAGISFIAHAIYAVSLRTENQWLLVAACYWMSLLAFGWFEYYFWLLASIEIPVICLLLAMVQKLLNPADVVYDDADQPCRMN